ncbi:MAG: ArnT family glycosyltransferase [Patescibacteria group bacterium]
MKTFLKKYQRLVLIGVLAFMLIVSLWNAWFESAIFDETAHIGAGYSYLTKGDMRLNPEHPPLLKDLAAFPLLFLNLNFETNHSFWETEINGQWEAGKSLLYSFGNDADLILFWSRVPIILLSLIFGWFLFYWGKKWLGIVGGTLVLFLYAFDPNILGHNHFVTTDLGIAAAFTFCFYFFLKFIREPNWKNCLLFGLFLGVLQLTKFSSVLSFPVIASIVLLYPLIIKKNSPDSQLIFRLKKVGAYVGKSALAFLISLGVVYALYLPHTWNMPQEKTLSTINHYLSVNNPENQIESYTAQTLNYLAENKFTRPIAYYALGVSMVFKRVSGGNSIYFMGQVSNQAFPSYFPTVFLLKETLFHLFLYASALLITLGFFLRFFSKSFRRPLGKTGEELLHYARTHIESVFLFLFVSLYLYISLTGNLNLGIRHLFPVLPFLYLLSAKAIITLVRKSLDQKRDFVLGAILFLIMVSMVLETALSAPYYMSYFNQIAGGSKKGYRFATDSNADWGQDLKRLRIFLEKNPKINKIRVDYFGGGNPEYYLENKFISWWDSRRPIEEGWYAISANYLQSSRFDSQKKASENYSWISKVSPQTQIGTSIFLYYIPKELAKQLNSSSN